MKKYITIYYLCAKITCEKYKKINKLNKKKVSCTFHSMYKTGYCLLYRKKKHLHMTESHDYLYTRKIV